MSGVNKEKVFRVKGTSVEPYTVKFFRNENALRIKCNCPAGEYMDPCEHWKSIFTGEDQEYLDISDDEILDLQSWLDDSDLDEALQNLLYFEGHEKSMLENLAQQKRALRGRVMDILLSEPQV